MQTDLLHDVGDVGSCEGSGTGEPLQCSETVKRPEQEAQSLQRASSGGRPESCTAYNQSWSHA
jgi:hypothetical protein